MYSKNENTKFPKMLEQKLRKHFDIIAILSQDAKLLQLNPPTARELDQIDKQNIFTYSSVTDPIVFTAVYCPEKHC